MKFFKEEDISKKDAKKLQRMTRVDSDTAERIKSSLDSSKKASKDLASGETRTSQSGQSTRTKPSARPEPPKTVEQTPLNKYIRGEAEQGRRVSQELGDAAGVRDAARRGEIKPVQAGESKPTAPQGRVNKVRLKGDLAAAGVDTSPNPSQRSPRNVRLADTTKGGPVRVIKPTQPAPAPKPEAVKKPVPTVSRRGALSKQVDPILKDLRRQGASQKALETRMSTGYDKNLKATADKVLKQIQGTKGVSQADVSRKQQEYRIKYKETQLKNKVKPQTKAKVKALLPSTGQTSAPAPAQPTTTKIPKNAASVQTSTVKAGGNLEFGKTKTGSFTYSGASSTNPAVSKAVKTTKVQVAPFKELPAGNTTVKVGDSTKRLDRIKSMKSRRVPAQTGRSATFKTADPTAASGSTFKSTTPQKVADLGKGTKVRSDSATIRGNASSIKPPQVKPRLDSSKVQARARRMAMGRIGRSIRPQIGPLGLGLGAYDAWSELDAKSKDYISRGGTGKTTTKDKARAITRGVASALGYGVGVGAAAPIALAPVPGARPAAFAAGMYAGGKASDFAVKQADKAFDASYDTIAGATKWQKKQMEKINRQNQGAGVSAQQASFKKGNKAIIRDAGGKERIGYAAKLTGKDGVTKTVYKHANDPKALRYTSSSPLERIGRALMPGRYAAKDEAARKKRVADFKKAALATEQYFTFLHITESMIAQGYDAEFIKEFWDWEDVKQVEFVNSLDLTEDIFIPDEEFLTEGNDLSENFRKFIDRMFKRITKKKVPTPTQTSSGRPITSSGTGTKGNANVTSSGTPITGSSSVKPPKQTPKLADKVKTALNNPKVRTAGLTAAGAGLVTLGGKLALDNNIIPGIPDTPDTEDSDADPKDPKDPKDPNAPKGPVYTDPDGNPKQFPPLTPPPPLPKKRLRAGHWKAVNDPPQFHRDPALAAYRNIRATKRNY